MAKLLNVSVSNFYSFVKREKDPLKTIDANLLTFVNEVWDSNKRVYGLLKIHNEVKKNSLPWGTRKIRKAMKLLGIQGKQEKKFRIQTTDSNHSHQIAPDLLQRNFKPKSKNIVWVSDVTYLGSIEGWLYLCVILDLYSRKIVSWEISNKNDSELISNTLQKAIVNRNPGKGLIFHSDRGSNYCSEVIREQLIKNKIRRSNSRKGNCWDNSPAESFFATLKREIEFNFYLNLSDSKKYIFDFIDLFYNRQRSHSFF